MLIFRIHRQIYDYPTWADSEDAAVFMSFSYRLYAVFIRFVPNTGEDAINIECIGGDVWEAR